MRNNILLQRLIV